MRPGILPPMSYRLISPDGTQSFDLKMHAPLIVGRAPDILTILTLVSAGFGLAFVPESFCRVAIPGVVYRQLASTGKNALLAAARAGDRAAPGVLLEAAEVGLELLPAQVRGVVVAEEHRAVLGRAADVAAAAPTRLDAPRISGEPAPGIGTRISRVSHQQPQVFAARPVPS